MIYEYDIVKCEIKYIWLKYVKLEKWNFIVFFGLDFFDVEE